MPWSAAASIFLAITAGSLSDSDQQNDGQRRYEEIACAAADLKS